MKCGRTPEGGLELALDPRDAVVFRCDRRVVVTSALLDVPGPVKGYRHLPQLRQALRRALELEEKNANQEAA